MIVLLTDEVYMKVIDYKNLITKRSNDFLKDNSVGIVLKTAEEIGENRYGIHIPRLMMGVETVKGPIEEIVDLDSNKCLNSINKEIGETEVISSNFINLTYYSVNNLSMPRLILGERVTVGFIDQDIKSMYIKPFCRDHIRKRPTDTMEMYVPASGNYDGDFLNDDNKYYVRCDSVSKTIRIHMSDANGEESKYDIMMDGENGTVTTTDGSRSITINTKDDEIFLINEAESTISLKKDVIDILCGKFYLKAKDSIKIESPKGEVDIENTKWTSKDFEGLLKTLKLDGNKFVSDYMKMDMKSKMIDIDCPVNNIIGLLTVSGYIIPGGLGFGPVPPNQGPLPINPQVKDDGSANFAGPTGQMLVRSPPLMQLLTVICSQLDIIAAVPIIPAQPISSSMLASISSQLGSPKVKG